MPGRCPGAGRARAVAAYDHRMALEVDREVAREVAREPERDVERVSAAGLSAEAALFHGFSDPSRLLILRHLALGEHRVVDLTAHLGLAQSTVSKHLACLKDCGLVSSRPEGRASMWSLTHEDEVLEVIATAERLLSLTGGTGHHYEESHP